MGQPCVQGRLVATQLAVASQCVSWHSTQRRAELPPPWQAHRDQALIPHQGAENGFGLLSGQIKAAAEAQGAVWAYESVSRCPTTPLSCLCQPPQPSSPSCSSLKAAPGGGRVLNSCVRCRNRKDEGAGTRGSWVERDPRVQKTPDGEAEGTQNVEEHPVTTLAHLSLYLLHHSAPRIRHPGKTQTAFPG